MYVFGAFLLYTGAKMIYDEFKVIDEKKELEKRDPNNNFMVKMLKKIMPVTDDMSDGSFFKKINGKIHATPFFMALLVIEMTDLVFAVDSIPAVLSVSTDTFIIYSSNIFAILGALYFALRGIMDYFYYLKYALSAILVFIGFKMIFNHYAKESGLDFHIANVTSLTIIGSLILVSVIASIIRAKKIERYEMIPEPEPMKELVEEVMEDNSDEKK